MGSKSTLPAKSIQPQTTTKSHDKRSRKRKAMKRGIKWAHAQEFIRAALDGVTGSGGRSKGETGGGGIL